MVQSHDWSEMAASKRTRWVCPNGCPAVLGPLRPRRENVVRYCLACSAKAGKLVERTAPAMEKKAQAGAERSAAKAKARREREAAREARKWTVDSVDLRVAMQKALTLPTLKILAKRPPEFTIAHSRTKDYTTGQASYRDHSIHLTIGVGENATRAVGVMLHELAHHATYRRGEDQKDGSRQFARRCHDAHDEWNERFTSIATVDTKLSGAYRGTSGRRDWDRVRTGAVIEPEKTLGIDAETYRGAEFWNAIRDGYPEGATVLLPGRLADELDYRYVEPWGGDVEEDPERAAFIEAFRAGERLRLGKGRTRYRFHLDRPEQLLAAFVWALDGWEEQQGLDAAAARVTRQLYVGVSETAPA